MDIGEKTKKWFEDAKIHMGKANGSAIEVPEGEVVLRGRHPTQGGWIIPTNYLPEEIRETIINYALKEAGVMRTKTWTSEFYDKEHVSTFPLRKSIGPKEHYATIKWD